MTRLLMAVCANCDDTGWTISEGRASRCDCRRRRRIEQNFALAEIPPRYRDAELATFQPDNFPGQHLMASEYAKRYPLIDDGERSLLLAGTYGTGKTHLAISIMKELLRKGIAGRFYDYCGLLKEIQNSYNPNTESSELEILAPVLEVEVMVLDDLGSMRPSAWVLDMVTLVLNLRYTKRRTTILTTNFSIKNAGDAIMPVRPETTLNARIGDAAVSRLHEMCRIIRMDGPDYRMREAA